MSPRFLFLIEPPVNGGLVDDFSLASRLSYFLWSSMPDDELLRVAESGILHVPEVLRSQVERMLDDPRSIALAEDFATQWLDLRGLGATRRPDPERFPESTPALLGSMVEEATRLFHDVLIGGGGPFDLIDARHTFVDDRLARHYRIDRDTGSEQVGAGWRRVTTDDHGGGVLRLGAVLTATSMPLRTSPVLRGRWVLEQLLGESTPPPPPDAGELPPDDRVADGLTLRERLAQHRSRGDCASCHDRMDPLGFALEGFDPLGRRRASHLGAPIDDAFTYGGREGAGIDDLKEVLRAMRPQVTHHLVRQLLAYSVGRGLDVADREVAARIADANLAGELTSLRDVIGAIVASPSFREAGSLSGRRTGR